MQTAGFAKLRFVCRQISRTYNIESRRLPEREIKKETRFIHEPQRKAHFRTITKRFSYRKDGRIAFYPSTVSVKNDQSLM